MKKLLISILALMIANQLCAESQFDMELKGKVEDIIAYEYNIEYKSGVPVTNTEKYSAELEYDNEGNKTGMMIYINNDILFYETKYDTQGNLSVAIIYNDNGSTNKKIQFSYDDEGNKIKETTFVNVGSMNRTQKWKYDKQGNMIEEAKYDYSGNLYQKTKYKYDEQGNENEKAMYEPRNGEMKLIKLTTSKYGYKGE